MASELLPSTAGFADDEIAVAAILVQLPRLVMERELSSRVSFTWGSKRIRSRLFKPKLENDNNNNNSRNQAFASPSAGAYPPPVAAEEDPEVKAEASSPATPLSFSPSESDGKRKASKRKSHRKRKREEWLEIIDDLTERKAVMKREIENVTRYYDKLKAFNLELKARKVELINSRLQKETPHIEEIGEGLNLARQIDQPNDNSQGLHHQRLIMDRRAGGAGINGIHRHSVKHVMVPSSNGLIPLGLPDLNFSAGEVCFGMDSFQALDLAAMADRNLSRAMASEARRRRIQIYRVKNSIAASKLRYHCR